MKTKMYLDTNEVMALSDMNLERFRAGKEFLEMNPTLDETDSLYQEFYATIKWDRYIVDSNNSIDDIDPLVLNTHKIDPFSGNQGVVVFTVKGRILKRAFEKTRFGTEFLHFIIPSVSGDFDNARYFNNQGWEKDDELGFVKNTEDIAEDETYEVKLVGGWNYVYVRKNQK